MEQEKVLKARKRYYDFILDNEDFLSESKLSIKQRLKLSDKINDKLGSLYISEDFSLETLDKNKNSVLYSGVVTIGQSQRLTSLHETNKDEYMALFYNITDKEEDDCVSVIVYSKNPMKTGIEFMKNNAPKKPKLDKTPMGLLHQ